MQNVNKIKKSIYRTIAYSLILITLVSLGLNLYISLIMYYIPTNYIAEINTKYYDKKNIKLMLDKFNEMGDNKALRFEPGKRKIIITDRKLSNEILGRAMNMISKCVVQLNTDINRNSKELEETLYHEILHCYGYMHTSDCNDLMYKNNECTVSNENIKSWAMRLKETFYEN